MKKGWPITLASSQFCNDAEADFSPIQGEALAVAWLLEQTRFFTMGCNDLLVNTDHEPLVAVLGDQRLDEILKSWVDSTKEENITLEVSNRVQAWGSD